MAGLVARDQVDKGVRILHKAFELDLGELLGTALLASHGGSGKTTLFNAITAGRGADGVGMVDVPDQRLTRLAEAVKPGKTTAAPVRVEETPPGSRAQRVAFARQADVLVKVARCFGPAPDPAAELEEFALDLVLADLASVERRLEIVAKEARAGKKDAQSEQDVLTVAKDHLDSGKEL